LRTRRIIELILLVVGIVFIAIGVFLITYDYTKHYHAPFYPLLPPTYQVYPYTLAGIVLITSGMIMLIVGGILFLIVKPEKVI